MSCRTRSVAVAVNAADRYVGEARAQPMQLAVLRAEIVAPFGDAMSLVDDQGRNAVGRVQPRQNLAFELGLQQALRRDVQQLQLAAIAAWRSVAPSPRARAMN